MIQNYWLSAPYGRNWIYLWSSDDVPAWQIAVLVIVFFIGIWIIFLCTFSRLSKSHSWILPVFAMGLGAPRWAQILWSTSNMGQYLPWTSGPVASALAGRSLWLWLGVLDAVQGVGECAFFLFPTPPCILNHWRRVDSLLRVCRFRHGPSSNFDPLSHPLHAHRSANPRFPDNYCRKSYCS